MLVELRINQLGLVDELVLPVAPGLTILTGETGAGKSMIAGAMALLTGQPVPKDLVRGGEELAWVEGVFDLSARDETAARLRRCGVTVGSDGILVLRREIRRSGRNRVLINGLVSSLAVLQGVGPALLAVQSQDQQRELSRPAFLRDLLDVSLDCADLRREVAAAHAAWRELDVELATRRQEEAAGREQLDLWRYQRDELAAAGLDAGEESALDESLALKRHAAELQESAAAALQALADGEPDARGLLGRALQVLSAAEGKSARLDEAVAHLREAEASAAEAAQGLERFLDNVDLDPGGLDELEARKSLYVELRRKYRREVPDLVTYLHLLEDRVARQESATGDLAELTARRDEAAQVLAGAAAALRRRRVEGAGGVSRLAEEVIRPLALPDLELQFSIAPRRAGEGCLEVAGEACEVRADGADEIDLLARPNPGERAGQVAAIASGGEKSRIHLGLTALQRRESEPPLQLFDEIDAGLGMDRARPVARLLRRLAGGDQVICITHLATVAVYGDHHWRARKEVRGGRTLLDLDRLDGDARTDEVARLLGGEGAAVADVDAAGRAYARDLLNEARDEFAAGALRDDLGKGG
ncbi:hypothetical protein H8E07_22675 [bacterium]|nr:hypothetical protein [bacterium]